jgi:hypothetical protein
MVFLTGAPLIGSIIMAVAITVAFFIGCERGKEDVCQ